MIFDWLRSPNTPFFHSCLAGCKCLCYTCVVVSLDAFLVESSYLSLQELRPAFHTILCPSLWKRRFHSVWGVCRELQTWPLECAACSHSSLWNLGKKSREKFAQFLYFVFDLVILKILAFGPRLPSIHPPILAVITIFLTAFLLMVQATDLLRIWSKNR